MTSTKRKFWIDTDCGVDDAHSILMVLAQPDVDVIGFSTSYGNATAMKSARNVLRVLQADGRTDIPIFVGVDNSLIGTTGDSSFFHGQDGLGDAPDFNPPNYDVIKKEHAISALTEAVEAYPGEVTVIALGPLTNLALALRLHPGISAHMRHLYVMGGNYAAKGNITMCSEFNFHCDPEAAHVVLRETACAVTLVCWEACIDMGMPWDHYHRMCGLHTPKSAFLKAITQHCLKNYYEKATLPDDTRLQHFEPADQVAVAVAIDPDIVTSCKSRRVRVELNGSETRGQMVVDWQDRHATDGPHINLIMGLDKEGFLKMCLDCLR